MKRRLFLLLSFLAAGIASAASTPADIKIFTANATWTIPCEIQTLKVIRIAAGGGGKVEETGGREGSPNIVGGSGSKGGKARGAGGGGGGRGCGCVNFSVGGRCR